MKNVNNLLSEKCYSQPKKFKVLIYKENKNKSGIYK